jgi:hypothetical protein
MMHTEGAVSRCGVLRLQTTKKTQPQPTMQPTNDKDAAVEAVDDCCIIILKE